MKAPAWHWIYLGLVSINTWAVGTCLYFSHRTMLDYQSSVMQTQALAADQAALIQLERLAADMDRPGNAVFETHDADLEDKSLAYQRSLFLQHLVTTEKQIKSSRVTLDFAQVGENFISMQQQAADLVAEAEQVISYYKKGEHTEASRHMARMDAHYAALSEILYHSIEWIGNINQRNLDHQFREAQELKKIELVAVAIMTLLLMATAAYGHKLSKRLKQNMLEYQRRGNYLRTVVDNAVDAIITINDDGIIHSFNPAAERLFGYGANEVVGKNFDLIISEPFLALVAQSTRSHVRSNNTIASESGREVLGKRKDGSTFSIELSFGEFLSTSQKREFVGTLRDISQRKQNEQKMRDYASQLEHARDEAQRAAQLKAEFLANMSHTIRPRETDPKTIRSGARCLQLTNFGADRLVRGPRCASGWERRVLAR